jgi:hypothetical protein
MMKPPKTLKTKLAKAKAKPEPAALPNIIDLCRDPDFFADWFKDEQSWRAWFAFLRVLFGLPPEPGDIEIFQQCTGLTTPNPNGYLESSIICGRRSGKSLVLALIAVYLACFRDYRPHLVKNERATAVVLAADRRQAQSIFRYIKGFLSVPLLAGMIERETAEVLELTNMVTISVETASHKTIRGRTVAASLNDEVCFWQTDDGSASPDTEIFAALRPAMATIPGAMLFKASSPYAKRGAMYDDFKKHYAQEGAPILVWKSPTWIMNSSVPQAVFDEAYERDPASAAAEFGAEWRTDITGWLDIKTIQDAVDNDITVRPPSMLEKYIGFCDPSGGVKDSFTLGIAHAEGSTAVLDLLHEIKAPFSPTEAVAQVAGILKTYGLNEVVGDRYGSQLTVDLFASNGITYRASERDRSTIYLDALVLFTSGRIRLLDSPRLVNQLAALERKSAPGGRDKIDHPRGSHDDVANAAAGALTLVSGKSNKPTLLFGSVPSLTRQNDMRSDHQPGGTSRFLF